MAIELQQLLLAVLLGAGYWLVYALIAIVQVGAGYAVGPRDTPPDKAAVATARAGRALANYLETLPWFAIAVIVAHLAQKVDDTTIMAGWVYLAARALYLPAYIIAIPYTRSLIWVVATFAILAIVIRTLG